MAGQRNNYGKRSHSERDYDNGGSKRRNPGEEKEQYAPGPEDTVYRYLCPSRKIGSIIGRGGDIVKQLRSETQSKIRIGESVPGCDERVVTIFSTSEETNTYQDNDVCPAQDALFKVHDRLVADESPADEEPEEGREVSVKLLVPSDQIGGVIGKGGQIVQGIRSDTGAQVRILRSEHLPPCALAGDELLQITGEPSVVKKALFQVSSRLHANPSRSQHLLTSAPLNMYHQSGNPYMGSNAGGAIMGLSPMMGSYGGYKSESYYGAPRDDPSAKEFSLRLVCPTGNIGGVIGKGGAIIKQIRQDSGAIIKVDSSAAEGDDCLITISANEYFEDLSQTIDAAVRLQPRCSEKKEKDSGEPTYTTRLLVPTSRIGCLIGKGGTIVSEMRKLTRANIRIFSKDNLPKVASDDDEMVQIGGDLDVAKNALIQVATRLRANIFDREGAFSAYPPSVPYFPMSVDDGGSKYASKESKSHSRGYSSYSGGYGGSSDLPHSDTYGYGGSHSGGGGYGIYSGYSGRSGSAGLSGSNPISHGKHHGY